MIDKTKIARECILVMWVNLQFFVCSFFWFGGTGFWMIRGIPNNWNFQQKWIAKCLRNGLWRVKHNCWFWICWIVDACRCWWQCRMSHYWKIFESRPSWFWVNFTVVHAGTFLLLIFQFLVSCIVWEFFVFLISLMISKNV